MTRVIFTLLLAVLLPAFAQAAPKAEYWGIWDKSDEASAVDIDHAVWQELLDQYVTLDQDNITKVNYKSLADNDKPRLDNYISGLTSLDPTTYNRAEQMAYWINLYNALTVKVIVDHYPVKSILKINISPGFFSFGPWGKKLVTINGTGISLNDIEHRILRPMWKDPRIHYSVNCASIGCPNLPVIAYSAEITERLLTEGAVAYINHPRGVRIAKGKVTLSTIFKWYKEDFGTNNDEILDHIRQYASDELRAELTHIKKIQKYKYDWDLNEMPTEISPEISPEISAGE